jgi:hypothetical protein
MAVRITGLNEVLRDLTALGIELDDLKDTMAAIATEGAKTMARFIPKKSGDLRGTARGNRAKAKAVVIAGRARVAYAGPINYGWPKRNIRPADFTGKTDEVMETKAVEMLDSGIDNLIRKKGLA